jgi:hypothetical protein
VREYVGHFPLKLAKSRETLLVSDNRGGLKRGGVFMMGLIQELFFLFLPFETVSVFSFYINLLLYLLMLFFQRFAFSVVVPGGLARTYLWFLVSRDMSCLISLIMIFSPP